MCILPRLFWSSTVRSSFHQFRIVSHCSRECSSGCNRGRMDMNSLLPKERPRLKPCCKNKKAPWMEGTLGTTYRQDFVGKEVPVERAVRKYDEFPNMGQPKFDGTTTTGNDYKVWEVKREKPFKPTHEAGSALPFEGASLYRQDFGPKEAPYERVRPKHAFQPNNAPFDGTTTNRTDFMPREVVPTARVQARGANIPTSAGPFDGSSLYKDTFQKHPYAKRQPVAPMRSSDLLPTGQFDDGTMYRVTFVPKEVSVPVQCRPQDARPQTAAGWFGGLPSTEQRSQYVNREIPTTEPIRALKDSNILPNAPFSGVTTNKADFVPFATAPAKMIRPSNQAGEALPFNGTSTYRDSFIPKEAPYKLVKPVNAFEPNKAPFDGTTTHRIAFIPREVVPTARVQARGANIPTSAGPFDGSSLYKDTFMKHPYAKRQPMIPHVDAHESGPFNGVTTYRLDFIEKEIPARERRARDDECESCIDGIPGITCRED